MDNAAAGISYGGRREASMRRMRTQKLVERQMQGEIGKYFDDAYAKKHWYDDANKDTAPELDLPRLDAKPDAIPTTPQVNMMHDAKVLDREAVLQRPVAGRSGGMKAAIRNALAMAQGDKSKTGADADVTDGLQRIC